MLEIDAVVKIKQFFSGYKSLAIKHVKMLEIDVVVKIKQFLVVINLWL